MAPLNIYKYILYNNIINEFSYQVNNLELFPLVLLQDLAHLLSSQTFLLLYLVEESRLAAEKKQGEKEYVINNTNSQKKSFLGDNFVTGHDRFPKTLFTLTMPSLDIFYIPHLSLLRGENQTT